MGIDFPHFSPSKSTDFGRIGGRRCLGLRARPRRRENREGSRKEGSWIGHYNSLVAPLYVARQGQPRGRRRGSGGQCGSLVMPSRMARPNVLSHAKKIGPDYFKNILLKKLKIKKSNTNILICSSQQGTRDWHAMDKAGSEREVRAQGRENVLCEADKQGRATSAVSAVIKGPRLQFQVSKSMMGNGKSFSCCSISHSLPRTHEATKEHGAKAQCAGWA